MSQPTMKLPSEQITEIQNYAESYLDRLFREGARQMLEVAMDVEVEQYIERHKGYLDKAGNRQVVRNGYHKSREILSGAGVINVCQPRVDDRRDGHKFTSSILPPYMRKAPSIERLIPCLYLKGVSTNQFKTALEAILGTDCPGLSSSTISDMMKQWQHEYADWNDRDLSNKEYAYFWADGVHVKVRLGDQEKASLFHPLILFAIIYMFYS